jgi:hypothetical protein
LDFSLVNSTSEFSSADRVIYTTEIPIRWRCTAAARSP